MVNIPDRYDIWESIVDHKWKIAAACLIIGFGVAGYSIQYGFPQILPGGQTTITVSTIGRTTTNSSSYACPPQFYLLKNHGPCPGGG